MEVLPFRKGRVLKIVKILELNVKCLSQSQNFRLCKERK